MSATILAATGKLRFIGWILVTLLLPMDAPPAIGGAPTAKAPATPKESEPPQIRVDQRGDPLPEGAIARLGTARWRHGFFVYDLAYSPDGKKIAAVGAGRAISLWDAVTGKELHRFPNRPQPMALAFSPDGKMLATADRPCHLWDVATGKELCELVGHQSIMRGIAFTPDGKQVVTANFDGTIRFWNPTTGKEQRRIDTKAEVCRMAYSPDGKIIVSSSKDGVLHLWEPATGKELDQTTGHKKAVWGLVFSADGKHLASSSEDGTIRLWDVAARRQVHVFTEEKGAYVHRTLTFSPDGTLLASGHRDGTIHLWNVKTGEEARRWQGGVLGVGALAFSPDGKTLASGAVWECIRLWDAATGRERHPTEEHRGAVDRVRFTPDGKHLVSIGRDRRLVRWDLATRTPRTQSTWKAKGPFIATALSPDGNTLAATSWPDFTVRLWDAHTSKPGRLLGKHEKRVWAVAFSPDGRLVASGGADGVIHVWEVRDGKEIRQIKDSTNEIRCLRFSPDGKALACGMAVPRDAPGGSTLRLWNLADGKERCAFDSHVSLYAGLAFSPDGKTLASGHGERGDSVARLWDAETGKELCRHEGHREPIDALAFSPDGKLVASGCGNIGTRDNSVHVWEAATGRLIHRFEGHHSCVNIVAFSPDGLTVASGAGDSTILLWDISGRRLDGRWHGKRLSPREMEACWNDLVNEDASKAYDAVWMLVAAPEQAVPFLAKHLHPVPSPDAKTIARLLADLDSEQFPVRQKATKELGEFGDAIAADLRRALDGKLSLEMRRRIQQLLDRSRQWSPERLRVHRAIQALEHLGSPEAREVLKSLAGGAPGARQTEGAGKAMRRLRD